MRSIVGTGPGGFRSMLYRNGPVVRPLLDLTRDELRDYLSARESAGETVVRDESGALWREDATNAHTDRFRAYVRHKIVPVAKEWNSALPEVLTRSMKPHRPTRTTCCRTWPKSWPRSPRNGWPRTTPSASTAPRASAFCPLLEKRSAPLQRRAVLRLLEAMLGPDARVEAASVEAVLAGFANGAPNSGYVANIQYDLAVSANKRGVLVEPMAYFRARRKKHD